MTENFIGKAVSIRCKNNLGVFQGHIKSANPQKITITKAFRNGVPLKKPEMEITIEASNIDQLDLLTQDSLAPSNKTTTMTIAPPPVVVPAAHKPLLTTTTAHPTPVIAKPMPIKQVACLTNGFGTLKLKNGFRGSPPKPQGLLIAKSPVNVMAQSRGLKPVDVPPPTTNGLTPYKNQQHDYKNERRRENGRNVRNGRHNNNINHNGNRNSAFGTPVDDPTMGEDFDFEKNLALFDKQAIWDQIENGGEKPDLLRQTNHSTKYRHDENVITSKPIQNRQIQTEYNSTEEYATDEGLIIPCIPQTLRQRVQSLGEVNGFTWERQGDLLGRGATELAMHLLGGSRRLIPKNQHQWPTISIICDRPFNDKLSEVGIITGRQLASHGLKVIIYVKMTLITERPSKELELYTATGNDFTFNVKELPPSDLVILAVNQPTLAPELTKWLKNQKCPLLAIDPPACGFKEFTVKCSLLPILPLEGIQKTAGPSLGKRYLCNLSIPLKFFRDSGIKYSSPFGSKFVIPLHEVNNAEK